MAGVNCTDGPYERERVLVACWLDSFASVNPVSCLEPVPGGWPVHHAEDCGARSAGTWWEYEWNVCPWVAIAADRRLSVALVLRGLADMGQPIDLTGYAAWACDYYAEIRAQADERGRQLAAGGLHGPSR